MGDNQKPFEWAAIRGPSVTAIISLNNSYLIKNAFSNDLSTFQLHWVHRVLVSGQFRVVSNVIFQECDISRPNVIFQDRYFKNVVFQERM